MQSASLDLVWLAGQGGDGIKTFPALGRLCAALILGGEPPVPPAEVAALGVRMACLVSEGMVGATKPPPGTLKLPGGSLYAARIAT